MLALAVDFDELVDEDGKTVVLHVVADDAAADRSVVIAENAVAFRARQAAQEFGAATGCGVGHFKSQRAAADEIAGDEKEVGVEGVDPGDDLLDEELLGVLLEVEVGELDDAEAFEGGWQIADVESGIRDFNLVPGDLVGVESKRGCRGYEACEEFAAGEHCGHSVEEFGGESSHKP